MLMMNAMLKNVSTEFNQYWKLVEGQRRLATVVHLIIRSGFQQHQTLIFAKSYEPANFSSDSRLTALGNQ